MKSVIITGGAGFVGVNVAHYFLNKGCRVVIFDNLSRKGCTENLRWLKKTPHSQYLRVLAGDVRSPTSALLGEIEQSDVLFHLAAQVAVTTSVLDPRLDFEVNAQGTLNMLELVRNSNGQKPVFIYASTNKVYGDMHDIGLLETLNSYTYQNLPKGIAETHTLDLHSPYGCSKGCADQYVRDYARIFALKTVVFRQSCIYGIRQFGVEDQGWVAWFVIAAVLGRPITLFGDGKQVRDILFIDDLVTAYELAWENIDHTSGQVYNIGGGPDNAVSLLDLIAYLREQVDPSLFVSYAPWRPGDQRVYISDITRAKVDFGWQPQVNWVTGVRNLVRWVKKNKALLDRMTHAEKVGKLP
jgi:CDP-paratose 2-epimerase